MPAGRVNETDFRRALNDLFVAVHETRYYISRPHTRRTVPGGRNEYIASLWAHAAESMRLIDPNLSARFQLKRAVWRDPRDWPYEKVAHARIDLQSIERELEVLMRGQHGQ